MNVSISSQLSNEGSVTDSGALLTDTLLMVVLTLTVGVRKMRNNTITVFIRIVAVATINFSLAWVQLLIKGGFY